MLVSDSTRFSADTALAKLKEFQLATVEQVADVFYGNSPAPATWSPTKQASARASSHVA